VVEAGAGIGALTVPLSNAVGLSGVVYAFEPNPDSFDILTRNLAIKELQIVVPSPGGLGAVRGIVRSKSQTSVAPGTSETLCFTNTPRGDLFQSPPSMTCKLTVVISPRLMSREWSVILDATGFESEATAKVRDPAPQDRGIHCRPPEYHIGF
jgi:FkbM family methyltransferase